MRAVVQDPVAVFEPLEPRMADRIPTLPVVAREHEEPSSHQNSTDLAQGAQPVLVRQAVQSVVREESEVEDFVAEDARVASVDIKAVRAAPQPMSRTRIRQHASLYFRRIRNSDI
jgi:hypothetical protein